jgi:hypothetical protein
LDRGYPAFWFFAWLLSEKVHFCARVTDSTWNIVRRFHASGKTEEIVTIEATPESRDKCRQYGLSTQPITVRLIRVVSPDGQVQIMMTSLLDADQFPAECFSDLYHLRWGIEENYKELKSRIQIENFTGKSVQAVLQDFHANILAFNLKSVIAFCAQEEIDAEPQCTKHRYQVNNTYALSALKHNIVRLLQMASPIRLIRELVNLILRNREPVRPGRKFPRKPVFRDRPIYPMNYKQTA